MSPMGSSQSVFPTARRVDAARLFAEGRLGDVSFAVVDTVGKLRCHRCRERFVAASVVKAMLLVAYLDGLARESRVLSPAHRAQLGAMIRVSDNASATDIHAHVGNAGLRRLAQRAGMRDFVVLDAWTTARITAADQARFFASIRALLPAAYRDYASQLLASVVPAQSWGIPEVSRPGWTTLFKGGWRKTKRGELVHQVARLEDGDAVIAIAILTDANPRPAYGRATIRGIAQRLLAPTLPPG
jgi:hypothetical protein